MISEDICSGFVWGENLFTGSPFLLIKNLVKFHFIFSDPNKPGLLEVRYLNKGWAPGPFTSIFENNGKVISYFKLQKLEISSSVPGSWLPNWLQGNPSISNPLSEFKLRDYCFFKSSFFYLFCKSSYDKIISLVYATNVKKSDNIKLYLI